MHAERSLTQTVQIDGGQSRPPRVPRDDGGLAREVVERLAGRRVLALISDERVIVGVDVGDHRGRGLVDDRRDQGKYRGPDPGPSSLSSGSSALLPWGRRTLARLDFRPRVGQLYRIG
jgi:hypothetical protein